MDAKKLAVSLDMEQIELAMEKMDSLLTYIGYAQRYAGELNEAVKKISFNPKITETQVDL